MTKEHACESDTLTLPLRQPATKLTDRSVKTLRKRIDQFECGGPVKRVAKHAVKTHTVLRSGVSDGTCAGFGFGIRTVGIGKISFEKLLTFHRF